MQGETSMAKAKVKTKPRWKAGDLKTLIKGKITTAMTIDELLQIVDTLWPTTEMAITACYSYTLGRFPYGWRFSVTNSWQNWMEKGFKHQFGAYKRPEYAIAAFIDYCIENNIQPHKLIEK